MSGNLPKEVGALVVDMADGYLWKRVVNDNPFYAEWVRWPSGNPGEPDSAVGTEYLRGAGWIPVNKDQAVSVGENFKP